MIHYLIADYNDPEHASAIVFLLNQYAKDPMGGNQELSHSVLDGLVDGLSKYTNAFTMLAFDDNQPVGFANCFESFSTFKCRPLINIHDLAVKADQRGKGIGKGLMQVVEQEAVRRDCCKITLEVLEGNKPAQSLYHKQGFNSYELSPELGYALFWEKTLQDQKN